MALGELQTGRLSVKLSLFKSKPAGVPEGQNKEGTMWRKPKITEICVGAEINSYISAAKN